MNKILHGDFWSAVLLNPIGYLVLLVIARRLLTLMLGEKRMKKFNDKRINTALVVTFIAMGTIVFLVRRSLV